MSVTQNNREEKDQLENRYSGKKILQLNRFSPKASFSPGKIKFYRQNLVVKFHREKRENVSNKFVVKEKFSSFVEIFYLQNQRSDEMISICMFEKRYSSFEGKSLKTMRRRWSQT